MTVATVARGRKPEKVQQTFILHDGEVKKAGHLPAFRGVCMVLSAHLPAVRDGDLVVLDAPHSGLVGEATVLEHTHMEVRKGSKTALALHIKTGLLNKQNPDSEEEDDG